MKLSIIIPARNEWPHIVHTIHDMLNNLEADGWTQKDFEIIIVDNCSNDDVYPQRGTAGTTSYLEGRGMYYNRILKVVRFAIAGNHTARNRGAEVARGKYLYFSDGHMSFKPHFFTNIVKACEESGGLVHGAVQWMGAYPPTPHAMGYGYTLKLGEEIKGTWNNYCVNPDKWFYVSSQGHWGVCVRRDQFLHFGGYPEVHRTYGGGEFYLDIKWWMFGSNVVTAPNAVGYHLASSRGYSYNHDDYKHNVLNIGYALGMDDWRERAYINWLRKTNKETMDRMMEEGEREMQSDRRFIRMKRKKSFNQLITEQPWNELNQKRHNYSYGLTSVFHDTWLQALMDNSAEQAIEAFKNSKYQKRLHKFIRKNMMSNVYLPRDMQEQDRKELIEKTDRVHASL